MAAGNVTTGQRLFKMPPPHGAAISREGEGRVATRTSTGEVRDLLPGT